MAQHGRVGEGVWLAVHGAGGVGLSALLVAKALGARVVAVDVASPSRAIAAELGADAVAAGRGLTVEVDDDLIETDFGDWEGLSFGEARERDPELHARWLGDTSVAAPGGESFDEVHARVAGLVERVTAEHAGRTVLLVSHVTPIKTALRIALDVGPQLLYRLHLDLASISIADFYPDGGASVRQVNRTSGL